MAIGVPTQVLLTSPSALNTTAGDPARCTLNAAAGGWPREGEAFAGVVVNSTAIRCDVNTTVDLGGKVELGAALSQGATTLSIVGALQVHARLSVSVGRQPYTDEATGTLLVRLSADACPGATLGPSATFRVNGATHTLQLSSADLRRGATTVLSFPMASLPPSILVAANATIEFKLGSLAAAKALPFVRLGASRTSQSVLDYATGAV